MISTGIVTLAATILFIVPYVCLLNVDALIRKPWRIYVESGLIAIFVSLVLTYFTKPSRDLLAKASVLPSVCTTYVPGKQLLLHAESEGNDKSTSRYSIKRND
jgi:hypothetical protein